MATKITIPVDFRATSNSMKEILQQFQQGMSQVDLSTTLGKKLKKTLDALKEDLSGFEEIAISPTVDRSGLAKAERLFEDFVKKVKSGGTAVEGANVFEFNLSKNELDILAQYSDKIKDLGRQLDRLKKSGSNRSAESYLTEIGQGGLLTLARNTGKSFKGQSTLGANASAMEKEAAATRDSLERLQANQQSLLAEATALQQSQRALQTQLKTATKQRDASQAIVQKGDFLAKFQGLDYKTLHTKSGALRGQTAVLNEFMTAFETGSVGGRISDANRSGAESVLKYLGFDATQISQLITQQISQIRRAIAVQLEIQDGSNDMLSGEAYQRIQNVQRRSQQYLTQYATSARYQQYEQEKNAVVDLTEQVTSAQNKIADNATEQAAIGEEIAKHQQLVTSLTSVITSLQRFQRQLDQSEIDELNEELEKQTQALADTKSNIVANKGSDIVKTRQKLGPAQDTYTGEATENLGRWEAENESVREAEQFTANLKQSIKQWMSAQQIINMVKDGIRQAYQDIQGLDKAMTNIAVVTDMSVGDLWGKINEYMSIAQQYGVSTQGVYEVSQLYYQQGLGTADVMAATTETLKMARIAGMDYADAADAMTVAIRSFKMEMSDAAHVTDVYSKVAAVTASDSQELAIAMSKTASSAESVGSSFENTTAMLAVMIETTRESAQNLGSALKSIISRYGEMKVGATVDAEGEALDYNKVDTALKSVGISIKDAQGQFRDFDEVIFELSEKWDGLDSVTQRYIATIMAGNRQQSRFIALVDNWERLDEVTGAAQDSEDAGLLQYAKTLDSLETKITNIKTSFQEFYMSIINGPLIGAALEGINNILKGFNKLGNWQSILNIVGLIASIKSIASLIVSAIAPTFGSIVQQFEMAMEQIVATARQKGYAAGQQFAKGEAEGQQSVPDTDGDGMPGGQTNTGKQSAIGNSAWGKHQKIGNAISIGGALAGTVLTTWGTTAANENKALGAGLSLAGNAASFASMGAAFGPWGAAIGALVGALSGLPALIDALSENSKNQEAYLKAQEKAEEKNIERAEAKNEYNNLQTLLKKYESAEETRYNSDEDYQAWIDINNQLVDAYPELLGYIDAEGNAIADVTNKTELLGFYMNKAAEASRTYYQAKVDEINKGITLNRDWEYNITTEDTLPFKHAKSIKDAQGTNWVVYMGNAMNSLGTGVAPELTDYKTYTYTPESLIAAYKKEGIDLSAELLNANTGGVLSSTISFLKKIGAVNYEDGLYTWEEHFNNYLNSYIQQNQLGVYQRGSATSNLSILASNEVLDDEVDDISGYTALLYTYAKEIQSMSDQDISVLNASSDAWKNLINAYSSLYTSFSTSEQQIISSLFENIANISLPEIQRTFQQDLKVEDYQNNDLYKIFTKQWYDANYTQFSRWAQAIAINKGTTTPFTGDWANKGLESFTTWMQHADQTDRGYTMENADQHYQEYFDTVKQALIASDEILYNFLNKNSDATIEAYIAYLTSEQKTIKKANTQASVIAAARQAEIRKIIEMSQDSSKGLGQLLSTDVVANTEFWSLLFTDVGSQQWATALEDFETEYGVSIAEFENFVYENFSTYVNSIGENIQTSIDSIDSLYESQTKGFEFDKAIKLFNEVAKDGETWDDIFTYTEDGKLVLQNFDEILARKKDNTITELAKMREGYNKATDALLTTITKDTKYSELQALTAEVLKNQYGFSGPQADEIVNWIANNANGTANDFIAFLESQGMILEEAERYYNENKDAINRQAEEAAFKTKAQNFTALLEGAFNPIETAYQTLASTGLFGYSATNAGELIAAGLFTQSDFEKQLDGTYNLNEAAQAKIASLPLWVQNAIGEIITSNVDAAIKNIESLGDNIFDASDADYSEAFSYLAEAGFQGKDIKKYINYALMKSVVGDPEQLNKYIGRELAHKMGRDYTDEFATEFDQEITASRENMVAAFKDNYIEQIKSYNDLVYKKIVGTATFEELEQLDDLAVDLNIDLGQFTGRLIDDLSTYAQSIIDNAYLSAEEKNKYLKEAATLALDARAMAQAYNLDETSLTAQSVNNLKNYAEANKTIVSSKNRLTSTQAGELIAAYSISTGLDFNTLAGLFDYNDSDSTFSLPEAVTTHDLQYKALEILAKTDEDVAVILAKYKQDYTKIVKALDEENITEGLNIVGSTEAFEEIIKSTQQAQYLGRETRVEKYVSTVEKFASGQKVTFDELISLYTDLGQTFDINQLYKDWLSGPEKLIENIEQIVGTDSLTSDQQAQIQAAKERGIQTLIKSIVATTDKALNNTATLDDLLALAKTTGIDLTGMVSKTSSGYGLNQQGMLMVAAARAQMTGDFSSEAAKLVDSYAGKGGIFGNVKALDNMLTAMEQAVTDTQTLINNAEAQAIKNNKQEDTLYKKEKESLEKQKELQEAQVQILKQAQQAFKLSDAKNAANFMGIDPFGGALKDYDNYVNSHKTAQEVLKAAYGNGGVIADYKQAGQLLNFIGYGQEWTQTDANKNLNTLLKYTTSEGTDFAAAYREIFNLGDALSDSEVLLEAAKLMDQAAEKMQKELNARIEANEAFAEWHKQTVDDTTKRVELSKEEVQKQFLDTETKDGETVPVLKDTELMSHITGKYMTTLNGKQVGITDATIQDIAQTRYGDDWKTALADAGNLTSFLKDIDTLFTNFKYDQSSDLSYDEQFASYAKGEAAAQEVEKRLNKLQEDLRGLVTTPESMAGLNEGLDESIEKAKELNRLLVEAKIGTVYTTGTDAEDENLDTGIIVGSIDKLENYKEQLAKLYNIEKEAIEFNEEQNLISYNPQEGRGFSYSIKQQPETSEPDVPGVKNPLIGTVQYTGQFNEIDTWIAENSHIQAVYTLTTPEDAKAALQKKLLEAREAAEALSAEANDFDLTQEENADLANSLDNAKAKVKELEAELADLETRYPTPDDGTVQLKVTGTAPESDAELIKWKKDLAKALVGAGNVSLKIVDDKGNIISDINSITKGQQITISAGLAEGTSKDTIQTLVDDVNKITGGLKGATVQIEVTGLTADTVATVTNLKTELEGLKNSPAASGVTIDISGNAAEKAAQIIQDINAAKNNGKPNEASLNFTVSYTVNGKAVDFNEKGLPVLPKVDEDTVNENADDGDKEDPGSITLTIKGVDPKSAADAKKSIDDLGKDVQITFKQNGKEFTDVNDLVPDTPIDIQIQYKVDEDGKSTSQEIVDAIGEIAGEKPVDITVTGLDDETAKKVTQLVADLAGLQNPPETINIEVKDKDGKSLTLANNFATSLGAIKTDYESTVTVTVKYVDENGKSVTLDKFTPSGKKGTSNDDTALNAMHSGENATEEAARKAVEEAARKAAEELAKKAAEEAARKAAEEIAKKAAEAEAARKAVEEEMARKAAEEAARKAAEAEAARKAEEEAAAKKAAEEAAKKEAERHAQEAAQAQYIEGSQLLSSMWNFSSDNIQLETSIDEFEQLLTDLTNQSPEVVAAAYERVKELYAEWERQKESLNNQATATATEAAEAVAAATEDKKEAEDPKKDDPYSDLPKPENAPPPPPTTTPAPFSTATGDTTQNTQNVQSPTLSFNEVLDELSNLADQAGTTAQQEADYYKQRIQQMEQEKTEVERKMESSPTLLSEYYHQYAEKYLRGDSEWSQQRQSYAHAKSTATDTVDETEEVIEEIQAIKEEAASIALITDDTEAQAALDNLNAKISKLVSSHPTLFINVKVKSFTLEDIILPAGEKAPSTDGTGQYTGNVNGIAYANGNVDSLIAGAHLANKTLVGELGPELGVWDGMYHLLGQNGAEFVNMPDDAIVFNHRQTEGILKGQMGHRGKALADGNITGPARVNSHTINPELAFAAFGSYADFIASLGGSGKTSYKFTDVGELEEWYNLLRKIAKLEAEINLIQAERENITDGHDYLKSLREQQAYLNEEIAVQKLLIDYKKEQLALERERIEQDEWWSKSLTFNEDGTLLSIFGNEVGGGEGVFAYLDMLNNLSGDQQVAALKKLGYSYIGKDGKALEGDELVKQFISEYQDVVGSYNELDDSILEAEATVASLTTAINELEQEIKDNQKELEQAIYDLLVEASEREIEQTEKQNELLKEANQKYIDGLNDALSKEQQLYEQNKAIEDRESLQRQLSLLRRSGGSASEIEALEQQLDDALKSEYFDQQQKMIEDIADANERQAELLEQQVKLQQDALEYQKENGVIWTKVYEVMSGSYEEILAFFTGQDTKFFEASALAQEAMLLQWAKMVGIYDEDRASKQAKKDATAHWTNGTLDTMFAEDETVSEYTNKDGTKGTKTRQEQYNELSDKDKKAAQEHYVAAYTDAILKGQTAEQARQTAYNSMVERFRMDADQGITRWDPRDKDATKGNPNGTTYQYSVPYTVYFVDGQIETGEGRGISKENARDWAEYYAKKRTASKQKKNAKGDIIYHGGAPVRNIEYGTPVKLYATGGLVDYTGVAMVHGSKSKPESFLNSDQTAQITQALRETTGKESILGSLQSTMEKLKSVIHNISTIDNSNNQSISIAPGAVVIQVEQLADSYDIEEVSRDVMNRMVAIANKATNRGVNRR